MSALSFRSVFMVASCAGAALGCYLVSLRVASERAALDEVQSQIVAVQRDIRLIETEIGTRGRLAQLERWNVKVLALSAPTADQFLDGGFQLASLIQPKPKVEIEAPVVLASASAEGGPADAAGASVDEAEPGEPASADELLHVASLKRAASGGSDGAEAEVVKPGAAGPARERQAVEKKAGDKPAKAASASVTKPVRTAKIDPLAPLPAATRSTTKKDADSVR